MPPPSFGVDRQHPAAARLRVVDRDAGQVDPLDGEFRNRIAIVGFAGSTREQAPFDDPRWEVWGLNQLYRHLPRADRWFDIHWNLYEETVPGTDHKGWAKACGIPFYMLEPDPDVPTAVRYPADAIAKHFDANYFTSTIAYMIALAVYEIDSAVRQEFADVVDRYALEVMRGETPAVELFSVLRLLYARRSIGLFGVDLAAGEEYEHQRPCAEFWIGQATARGISVAIPDESALCKGGRYGTRPLPSLLTSKEVADHRDRMIQERDLLYHRSLLLEGARQTDEYWTQLLQLRERGAKG